MDDTWSKYVLAIGGTSQSEVARRTGFSQPTVGRWIKGTHRPTETATAAQFARAYGRNPLEAFIAADMLTEDEAGRALTKRSRDLLASLRSTDLVEIVRDRLAETDPPTRQGVTRRRG